MALDPTEIHMHDPTQAVSRHSHQSRSLLPRGPANMRAFAQIVAHRAHAEPTVGLALVKNFHLIRLGRRKRKLFEWRPRYWALCDGRMESAHRAGLLPTCEETPMLSTRSMVRVTRFRNKERDYSTSLQVKQCSASLHCSISTNDLLPLSPCVYTRPSEHAHSPDPIYPCLVFLSIFLCLI